MKIKLYKALALTLISRNNETGDLTPNACAHLAKLHVHLPGKEHSIDHNTVLPGSMRLVDAKEFICISFVYVTRHKILNARAIVTSSLLHDISVRIEGAYMDIDFILEEWGLKTALADLYHDYLTREVDWIVGK